MGTMLLARKQIDVLSPIMIKEFIATGECRRLLDVLEDYMLNRDLRMGSHPLGRPDSYQTIHGDMNEYLQCVKDRLKGQS